MSSSSFPPATEIARAAELLRAGDLVAFPTETVYGLGADALNASAVAKVFALKGRPAEHPLIVHVASNKDLDKFARELPRAAYELGSAFWPGPLTLIIKRAAIVPDAVTGGQDTVGVRVPSHPVAQALLQAFGGGIAAPSANRFGHVSPTKAEHVRADFGDALTVLDGGECEVGIESTIVDLTGEAPRILRPGAITQSALERALGSAVSIAASAEPKPRASGTLQSHYAPATLVRLVSAALLVEMAHKGQLGDCAVLSHTEPRQEGAREWRAASSNPQRYAHDLYDHLRVLDRLGARMIVIEDVPDFGLWASVRDRLAKAAAPREGALSDAT